MRLTRRGYGAVGVVAVAVGMAWLAGPRALNALAAPVVVALVAGAVQVYRVGAPTVERSEPRRGFPGEDRTVTLDVEGGGVASVEDTLSEGLSGTATGEGALPTTVTYDIELEARGEQTLGPTTVGIRDALGLVETTHEVDTRSSVLVYPRVSVVDTTGAFADSVGAQTEDRTAFDSLREYAPGDPLRDIHWPSTAKYDDLLVAGYADPGHGRALTILAEAEAGHADAMAGAAASLLVGALREQVPVHLITPAGAVGPDVDTTHQLRALEVLAETGAGTPTGTEEADLVVSATADGVVVQTPDRTRPMADLTIRGENPLVAREGSA